MPFVRQCGKYFVQPVKPHMKYGACALHAGYKAKITHSEYVILLVFHSNKDCTKVCHCYVIRTMRVLGDRLYVT